MSNPEEKKCCNQCVDYMLSADRYSEVCAWKECPCHKPSPSQSCEHDKGDHWRGVTSLATKKEYPDCCPYCKPAAAETSVESIAFALVHKFSIYTEDGTFFTNNEPNEPKKLELLIAEALRNERNRK